MTKIMTTLMTAGLVSAVATGAALAASTNAGTAGSTQAPAATTATPSGHAKVAAKRAMDHKPMMSHRRVEEIQAALQSKGEQLAVDGIWGPKTTTALRDFQKKNGLKTSGRFDHATAEKLDIPHWHA